MKFYALRLIVALTTFVIGLTSATVLNAFRFDTATSSAAQQEILQIERQYVQAHLQKDTATLDNILADEFTISSYRRVTNKDQRLALLRNQYFAFESINTDEVKVDVNGDNATVTGEAVVQGRYGDREFTSPTYRFIREYEKRQGLWQIVSVRVLR